MKKFLVLICILGVISTAFAEVDKIVEGQVDSIRVLPDNSVDFSLAGVKNIRICKANSSEPQKIDPDKSLVYKFILNSFQNSTPVKVGYVDRSNPNTSYTTKCLLFITRIK